MIYWLKTKADIEEYGYEYDTHSYSLDENAMSLDLGPPSRVYTVRKIIGTGSSISGGDTYSDRTISFSRVFKRDGASKSGALTAERRDFISKYILSRDQIFLVRDYNDSLQYIRVYPILKGEAYKKLVISEDVGIDLLCTDPFFKSTTGTVVGPFTKSSRFHIEEFVNTGAPAPGVFSCKFDGGDGLIKVVVFENIGVEVTHTFETNDTLKLDLGKFRIWINNVERFNIPLLGSPFDLLSGVNKLVIDCASNLSNCKITYTGRHL
jgi:hypothetical protein